MSPLISNLWSPCTSARNNARLTRISAPLLWAAMSVASATIVTWIFGLTGQDRALSMNTLTSFSIWIVQAFPISDMNCPPAGSSGCRIVVTIGNALGSADLRGRDIYNKKSSTECRECMQHLSKFLRLPYCLRITNSETLCVLPELHRRQTRMLSETYL